MGPVEAQLQMFESEGYEDGDGSGSLDNNRFLSRT